MNEMVWKGNRGNGWRREDVREKETTHICRPKSFPQTGEKSNQGRKRRKKEEEEKTLIMATMFYLHHPMVAYALPSKQYAKCLLDGDLRK